MEQIRRRAVFIIALSMLLLWAVGSVAQEPKSVLEPENYNERRLNGLQPPDQVMDAIGIVPGMVGAEIGAGHGRYVVHLAVRVGERGKIYAEDINGASLKHLDSRCTKGGLKNVETILGEVMDPKLPEGELDFIFIISSYHHIEDPVALLKNAKPSLKSDGFVAIGEWLPRDSTSSEARTPERITAEMKKAGYQLDRIETLLQKNRMNLYVFLKK